MSPTGHDRPSGPQCTEVREGDRIERYVSGNLHGSEAEAFEAHYFACEECWSAVQSALEVRAAFAPTTEKSAERPRGTVGTVAPAARRRAPRAWAVLVPAAVAAVLVGVALFGIRGPTPTAPSGDVLRGGEASLTIETAALSGGGLSVRWGAYPEADLYVVRIQSADGALLLERRVSDPRLEVGRAALPASFEGGAIYVRVEALDSLRSALATSPVTRIDVTVR